MARAKGLSPARIMFAYAGRNAVLPNLTGLPCPSVSCVGGHPRGVRFLLSRRGYILLSAVENEDYALMQTFSCSSRWRS